MKFALFLGFWVAWSNLYGQINHSLTLGPDLGIPGKNFGSEAKMGIGGSLEYQLKFKGPIGIQFHIGYNHFKNVDDHVNFLPVRLGLVGFIYQDIFFISADAGISHYSASVPPKQTGFSFGIGAGYKLYFNPESNHFLQLSAYYNLHNFKDETAGQNYNYTWFNIRAAYGFSFGKRTMAK